MGLGLLASTAAFALASLGEGPGLTCTPAPVYDAGAAIASVCGEDPGRERVVLDLRDDWAPRVFSPRTGSPPPYRGTFVALANEHLGLGSAWERARRDRHFELFGIFPSLSVLRDRLLDAQRHECHAALKSEDAILREIETPLTSSSQPGSAARRAAVSALQAHLACERLLPSHGRRGSFDAATSEALAVYQRRHMLPSLPVLDAETRATLLIPSRELDFRSLLRSLRERVADAAGLIEDGSAQNAWEPVLGRHLDSAEYRRAMRGEPLTGAAPDLVDRATRDAAIALGWTSPEAAAAALRAALPPLVALRLPPLPAYYRAPLTLRAEIELGRGSRPGGSGPSSSGLADRPVLTLIARTTEGDVPLVRWPTTMGGWKREKLSEGVTAPSALPAESSRATPDVDCG